MTLAGLAAAAVWQSLVYAILKFPFRRAILWVVFIGSVASGPLLMRNSSGGSAGFPEQALIWTMSHLPLCAAGVLLQAIGSYAFSASRDREVEYP